MYQASCIPPTHTGTQGSGPTHANICHVMCQNLWSFDVCIHTPMHVTEISVRTFLIPRCQEGTMDFLAIYLQPHDHTIHQLSSCRRSCLPLCWRHIVIKGYYVSHVILFSSLLLTTKRGELAVVFIRTLRGEWWRSRHIVYWHMIVIKMTLQNNSTVKRGRNRCVCLRLACLCMSVYGCTDTTRG